jgi:ribosomal protein L32
MNEALIELVEQLMEFGYGDPVRLESILKKLKTEEPAYPSDRRYVDMLVSKYLYPHVEEDEYQKKSTVGSLEKKIQTMKQRYAGETKPSDSHLADICPKCGTLVPRMFSFCSRCGAFHDEHNFIDTRKSISKKEKLETVFQQDPTLKSCIACGSGIFRIHDFCPRCGVYQGKNSSQTIPKRPLKQKRYAGLGIVGIIFIILGGISTMFLFGYSNLCSSIIGIFAQLINQQTQQICTMIQTWYFIGIIVLIVGIILLTVRAAKISSLKKRLGR